MALTVAANLARLGRRALAIGAVVLAPGLACSLQAAPQRSVAATPAPLRLSLAHALDQGLSGALELRQAAVLLDLAQAAVALSQSRFLPRLDLVGLATSGQVGGNVGFISNVPSIGDLNLAISSQGYGVVQNSFVNGGLALNYSLLDFARGPLREQAKALREARGAEFKEQGRRSRFAITAAYLNLQLASSLILVWERSLELSTALLRDARALRRHGLAARIESLQAEALVGADRSGLAEAQAQRQIAASSLARLLNLPAEQGLEASDPLRPEPAWPLDLATSLQRSLQNRPSLQALSEQRQAALAQVQVARAARLPSLGLLLGAGYSGDSLNVPVLNATGSGATQGVGAVGLPGLSATGSSSGSFYDWGAVLTLRQRIFDGGAARSAIDGAQQQTRLSEIALEQARQSVVLSVQTWWAVHQAAQTQMDAGRAAVRAAEQARLDAQLRYRASIAPILEVLITQRDLQAARAGLAVAIQRWNLSRAGLVADTGELASGMAGALTVDRTARAASPRSLGQPAASP
jgi:outer membrane protein TolC